MAENTMKLLNNYIMVRKAQAKETDGLQFAQAVDDFIYRGEIVDFSDDIQTAIITGQTAYFLKHAGEEIEINGEKMKFVKLEDLIAIE